MGQMIVRRLDDAAMARLKVKARATSTSVEAIARDAIHKAAALSVEEKLALVRRMQERSAEARVPGMPQSLGVDLIREDRDRDH